MVAKTLALFALATASFAQPASLIVRNARVWTGDPKQPWADSFSVSGDVILAVGNVQGGADRIIDAKGRLVVPGFIDSHVHLIDGGMRLISVQLRDAKSKQEFIDRIRKYAATVPAGTWITGGDWDHQNWGGELPTRQWIDAVTPKHPVWVSRLDGHMALANSLALDIAKVDKLTPLVEGGTIVRDAKGEITGILKDNAKALVAESVPAPAPAQLQKALESAISYLNQNGVTSVHHMGHEADPGSLAPARGRLRIYAAAQLGEFRNLANRIGESGFGDRWLRIGLIKAFMDGSLGSHTAAFEKPYTDAPNDTGLLVLHPDELHDRITTGSGYGLYFAVHAIGDRANRLVLDVIDRTTHLLGDSGSRHRIEHAQHLNPDLIARMARLQIVASMQPYHAIDDGRWAEKSIGPERAKYTYAFRSLLDANVPLAFGSDWFVAPPDVMMGIYAAVTRQTLDGKHPGGWVPAQRITVEEALRAYTYGGAFASFEEGYKGKLAPKYLADFVMLDQDIFKIPPSQIKNAKVALTVVGGHIVHERK